ncbi:MAG TPA: RHS repeat domain-containing protein, partial [Thermoanaerobaculia bacterium]|nr:RHS repeat domain-containing protein [Thermoanaerobaculia bacterium]
MPGDLQTAGYVYRYDSAGRLEEVERDRVVTASYSYDANGNRLAKTTPEGTDTGTYDAQDRMTSYGAASFTYTANGELLARVDPEGTTGYDYDVLGNLRSVSLPDGTAIEYLVDARHRRIGRKVDGTLERGWLWASQLAPAAELDAAGQVTSRYVHATRVNAPDLILRDGATYRLLTDPLGSPRLAVDTTTGAVVQRMDYDEWGGVQLDTNPGW